MRREEEVEKTREMREEARSDTRAVAKKRTKIKPAHTYTHSYTYTHKYSYTLHTKISNSKLLMSQTKKAMMTTRQQKEEGQKVGQGEGQNSRELVKYQVGAQAAELRLQ